MIAGVPTSYLMGSRGCFGSCAYCCITTLHRMAPGKRFRQRDPERVAEEMAWLYHEKGTRQFIFHDDNFLVPSQALNRARMSALEKALNSRGVKGIVFVIKCRPADANVEILQILKELGLVRVFFGIESATEQGLKVLERNQTIDDSVRALEACAKLDISAQFTLMTFNPDATLATISSDIAFMRRFSGNPLNFCRTEIYEGTPLEKRMVELGRARGDYRAKMYRLLDPVADLACSISLDLFGSRCWGDNSLMQNAIGLDHVGAVLKRFHRDRRRMFVCNRIADWVRTVNVDTIGLLEEIVELSASAVSGESIRLEEAIQDLKERESFTRKQLFSEAMNLEQMVESSAAGAADYSGSRVRFTRQAAAAVLAIGIPAAGLGQTAAKQPNALPPVSNVGQKDAVPSLAGTITDPTGAVVPNATITIRNLDTGETVTLKTNEVGQYYTNTLKEGQYSVRVQALGFAVAEKTAIVLKAGSRERADLPLRILVDLTLQVRDMGCCEYVAVPMTPVQVDYLHKSKPFTYLVGEAADHNTLQGVAQIVYGDKDDWVRIFEANRHLVYRLGYLPNGTGIQIPKRRKLPRIISKVKPVYPPEAESEHIIGDVLLELSLNEDGTVKQVDVVDGDPILASAAATAVKQWRYNPTVIKGKPVEQKFMVAISFKKGGKVR